MDTLREQAHDLLYANSMNTPFIATQNVHFLTRHFETREVKASTKACLQGMLDILLPHEPRVIATDLQARYLLHAILISMHPLNHAELDASATKVATQFDRMLLIATDRYDAENNQTALVAKGEGFYDHLVEFETLFRTWEKLRIIRQIYQDLDRQLNTLYTIFQDRELDTRDVHYIQIHNAIKELRNRLLQHGGLQPLMQFDALAARLAAEHRACCLLRQEQRRNRQEGFDFVMM